MLRAMIFFLIFGIVSGSQFFDSMRFMYKIYTLYENGKVSSGANHKIDLAIFNTSVDSHISRTGLISNNNAGILSI